MGDLQTVGNTFVSPTGALAALIRGHKIQPEQTKSLPTFYRNLEEALDVKRASNSFYSTLPTSDQDASSVDFCSGDVMSMGGSAAHREEFLAELDRHPKFDIGTTSTRLLEGNYPYIEQVESEIAAVHGAQTGLLLCSGFEANVAIWTTIPKQGDVILYDALVHASTHDGMRQSLATDRVGFPHSDIDAFRDILQDILATRPLVHQGKRSVIIAVEAIYSMDGDVCPLQELLDVTQDVFQNHEGGVQFVVDEAHSVGILGSEGRGLVCELGLEKQIAVVMHSFGKAFGASGAPTFPHVAAIWSGYKVLSMKEEDRERIHDMARLFFDLLTSHPLWQIAKSKGILHVPLAEGWEDRMIITHLLSISTKQKYFWWLYFHFCSTGFRTFPVTYPAVAPGQSRMRVIIHAHNTEEQIEKFVDAIYDWTQEMLDIDEGKAIEPISKAAKEVYAWMRQEKVDGFGMV